MWHSTTSYLTWFCFLFKKFHWNILPDISRKIYQYSIDSLHDMIEFSDLIIVSNLCRILLTLKSKTLLKEWVSKFHPINIRICYMMSIEIPRCTTEFPLKSIGSEFGELFLKPFDKNHHLLSEIGRCRWLSMCTSKHRDILVHGSHIADGSDDFLIVRNHDFFQRYLHCNWCSGIVDVLTRESKVDPLSHISKSEFFKFFLYKIFYSFYVMIGCFFCIFDPLCISNWKFLIDTA